MAMLLFWLLSTAPCNITCKAAWWRMLHLLEIRGRKINFNQFKSICIAESNSWFSVLENCQLQTIDKYWNLVSVQFLIPFERWQFWAHFSIWAKYTRSYTAAMLPLLLLLLLLFYRTTCVSRHSPVNNWRILLEQSCTAHMSLLTATSAFGLGRRHYLHCLSTLQANPQYCTELIQPLPNYRLSQWNELCHNSIKLTNNAS